MTGTGLIEARLAAMGLVLPAPLRPPPGAELPFPWVQVRGERAFISGHGPLEPDGTLARPLGKVGAELTAAQGRHAARLTALAMLSSLRAALGSLDRVASWSRVFGMVNSAPGFNGFPDVINGFSEVVVELWGAERGQHARSAVGLAGLPFDIPVEIEAEVSITP
jgi:enamine deaminase RidA (YjgF/YER057c/UK114 family)